MTADDKEMTSFRVPADVLRALRERAAANGESLSDILRRAALMILGVCPTCERPVGTDSAEGQ